VTGPAPRIRVSIFIRRAADGEVERAVNEALEALEAGR